MNKIFTLTGPSCSGKSTLSKKLVETGNFEKVISTTTRSPRSTEINGEDYYFINKEQFLDHIDSGEFIEFNKFNENLYGIYVNEIERILKKGKTPLIIIEPIGLKNLRKASTGFSFYSVYIDGVLEDLYTRFLNRFKDNVLEELMNVDAIKYEASRLVSLTKEHQTWWLGTSYEQSIPVFNATNEDYVVKMLTQLALDFRKTKNYD